MMIAEYLKDMSLFFVNPSYFYMTELLYVIPINTR